MNRTGWIGLYAGVCLLALLAAGCGPAPKDAAKRSEEGKSGDGPQGQPRPGVAEAPAQTAWPLDSEAAQRRQQETASRLGVQATRQIDLGAGETMELVLIPAGEFDMGSPPDEIGRVNEEGPVRRVRITQPYWLGRTEVTQGQWQAVLGGNPARFEGDDRPVEQVSWEDAQEFCRRLSEQTGLAVALPTEAQWEYACRAGRADRYGVGDEPESLPRFAWFGENSDGQTHSAAQKQPNAWGLYDMHGNVWEWCHDRFARSYENASTVDPQGPDEGATRVLRGGSWRNLARYCRSAYRLRQAPEFRSIIIGFRVAVELP